MKHISLKQIGCLLCIAILLVGCVAGCASYEWTWDRADTRATVIWDAESGEFRKIPNRQIDFITIIRIVFLPYLICLLAALSYAAKREHVIATLFFVASAVCTAVPLLYLLRRNWSGIRNNIDVEIFGFTLTWYILFGFFCFLLGLCIFFTTKNKEAEFDRLVTKLKAENDAMKENI
jgi:hypothetical protein